MVVENDRREFEPAERIITIRNPRRLLVNKIQILQHPDTLNRTYPMGTSTVAGNMKSVCEAVGIIGRKINHVGAQPVESMIGLHRLATSLTRRPATFVLK